MAGCCKLATSPQRTAVHLAIDSVALILHVDGVTEADHVPAMSSPPTTPRRRRSVDHAQTLLDSEMGQLLGTTQEISVIAPRVALALRPGIGEWRYSLLSNCFPSRTRFPGHDKSSSRMFGHAA